MKEVTQVRKISINITLHHITFATHCKSFQPLQVDNFDSNSRLVVDEDEHGKFGFDEVKQQCECARVSSGFPGG